MAKETRDFDRRCGRARRVVTWALIVAPLAMAATALLGFVGRSGSAVGAGPRLEPLHGHQALVPPGATLLGPAPSSAVLPLVVTLQPRDQAALSAEAHAVSDPTSPDYHHFLNPGEFAQRYGPTPATIAQVTAQLKQSGLTVGPPSSTGLSLPVSGTVAQVQSAFATPIDRYRLSSGKTGYHNRAAPEVPVTVAPQIEGVLGLDTLSPPHPSTTIPQANASVPRAGALGASPALPPGQPAPVSAGNCASNISTVQSTYGALNAVQLAQAYSFDPLYSSGYYGSGKTVALVEMSGAGYSSTDIGQFATCYGITLGNQQVTQRTVAGGGGLGGGTVEAELDIETVLSLAPKANIEVYEGGATADMYSVFNAIVSDDTAKIVSASWTNGCEAYVAQAYQNSENTLFQTAAIEGQSIFVASGDQGAEGCNFNGVVAASTNSQPGAQVVDPSTGTLYIANKSSGNVTVDSEGSSGNPSSSVKAASVLTGSGPDAVALDTADGKVFVANAGSSSLTVISTATCKQAATSGCASPTQIASSAGDLTGPTALAVNGSTLYVANSNGTVAVFNASTNAFKALVTLLPSSSPTALAVDGAGGVVYVGDAGSVSGIDYFNASTCNATNTTLCGTTPATVSLSQHPVSMVVDDAAGSLYVANAGTAGISVVSLSSHTLTTTIPTSGTGIAGPRSAVSVALAPSGNQVLAVLDVLDSVTFPGDVLATINPTTQTIISTVNLETTTDTMGALAVDGTRNYVWVADPTANDDVVQNLNLGVTDPASQPYVTAVGGTSVSAPLGPAPTETTWNDQLRHAEGAGGGGISQRFVMPSFQQPLGTVTGSSGMPCGNASGDCREVPDVSADADPSTGYIIYDSVLGYPGWTAIGGTSGAAPLWAAVLAVAASADGNTGGYGAMNPILYTLAQKSPGTYLNDVTTGNNDYNAANSAQFSASSGYDMATGLGTPITSALATGLTAIPLEVAVSGSQRYGEAPTFTATPNFAGSNSAPFGVSLSTVGLSCSEVGTFTAISPTLPVATYTLLGSSCSGATLAGANASDYTIVYTSATGDFTVAPAPVNVAVSGSQTYGGVPAFSGSSTPPAGITVTTSGLSCTELQPLRVITPALAAGSDTLLPESCAGATLSGTNSTDYTVAYTSAAGDFTVAPAPLTISASNASMTYGGAPPTIIPGYSGFVNSETPSSLTTKPTCSTTATSASPVSGSPYASSCSGTVDPNYSFAYVPGGVTIAPVALTITAPNTTMTYGSAPPAITPVYGGFVNGDNASSLTTKPTCSTTATSASPVAGSPYPSSCSGAVDANYAITYFPGTMTVNRAPLTVTASSGSMTYGGTPPAVTPAYTGFKNGDNVSSLTSQATCSTTATASMPASPPTYPATCTGASGPNYAVSYVAGATTINRATLTVTASNGSMTYGGARPTIIPGYSGFVNSDTVSSLTTKPTCSTTATSASPVAGSPYSSSCTGAVDPNYSFAYTPGVVTITPVPLTVTAPNTSMTYGSAPPAITPVYGGFVNGDTASSLTTKPTCSTTATSASPVAGSPYPSSCSGAVDANYTITYFPGTMAVNQARLTVTASSGSMTYGGTPPAVTASYSGFKKGDSASSLTPQPTCSTTATSTSPPSPSAYSSTCSGAADANYAISFVDGVTDVTPAPIPVAVVGSQAYGGAPGFVVTPPSSLPPGLNGVGTAGIRCSQVAPSTTITPTLAGGSYTLMPASCGGAILSGPAASDYTVVYAAGTFSVTGGPPPPPPPPAHGYWLVGSDGGIFTFGSATFHGSTGSLRLQRPVVGITPTADQAGYWLVASDGGIFAFGDAGFHGSIPGLGLSPAGSGLANALNAPIVGMVPSADGGGYFMVASDGGVFAFGDAQFAGSCPGIGGCSGAAVAVLPDATGGGYWLVTKTGNVYTFGDAPYFGAPGPQGSPITAAVRSAEGHGYFVLLANGTVDGYGDAVSLGGPTGAVGGLNAASAVFTDAGGGGYWVASAAGAVFTYGDAPNDGSMTGTRLNGSIIAGTGF